MHQRESRPGLRPAARGAPAPLLLCVFLALRSRRRFPELPRCRDLSVHRGALRTGRLRAGLRPGARGDHSGPARKTSVSSFTTRMPSPGWNSPINASSRTGTSSRGARRDRLASSLPFSSGPAGVDLGTDQGAMGGLTLRPRAAGGPGMKAGERVRRRKPGRIDPCPTDGRERPRASPAAPMVRPCAAGRHSGVGLDTGVRPPGSERRCLLR